MSATYYPIVSHGGIPIMTAANGGITTKHLLEDTRVGKKVAPVLPHLIANTVDALARGTIRPEEVAGETSVLGSGTVRKLVKDTKVRMPKKVVERAERNRVTISKL
jgi:hypothetical protein